MKRIAHAIRQIRRTGSAVCIVTKNGYRIFHNGSNAISYAAKHRVVAVKPA